MKIAFPLTIVSSFLVLAHAHEGHHGLRQDTHDHEHDESHHHHHRALKTEQPFAFGEKTYANQKAFIDSGSRCGQRDPTEKEMQTNSEIVRKFLANKKNSLFREIRETTEIATYFHIITDGSNGEISDSQMQAQLDVINKAYLSHGFSFAVAGITRTENSDWSSVSLGGQAQTEMKESLHEGDASTLNVYLTNVENGILGYATFPEDYDGNPLDDGVVILNETIPGGKAEPYNEGDTLTHEVGHWMGLYHTFQAGRGFFGFGFGGGCNFNGGDEVSDTPREKEPAFGCMVGRDTCRFRSGLDPVRNYMDYSDDSCLDEFTVGQADRMQAMWTEYRSASD